MALTESSRDRRLDFPFLEGRVELNEQTLEVGSKGFGRLHLRNAGSASIEFHTDQPLTAVLLDLSTMAKVAGFEGWIAGTGLVVRLAPGDETTIAVLLGSTARRNGEVIALAPGDYLVQVDVPIYEMRPDQEGYEKSYLTMPVAQIRLVKRS